MPRRKEVGVVISDKAAKTRRVEIPRLVRHPKYGKYLRRRTICQVHDEQNESRAGDVVEIEECRPLSRLKRWRLLRVVERGRMVDLATMRAATRTRQAEAPAEETAAAPQAGSPAPEAGLPVPEAEPAGPEGGPHPPQT